MITSIERQTNGTVTLTITIPWTNVVEAKEAVILELLKTVELPGFRKGKAPRESAEKKLDTSKIYEEVIQKLLPDAYSNAVRQHNLHPVVLPKIEIVEAKEESDWIVRAHTAEKPEVVLGDYKKSIREAKSAKRNKIWTPSEAAQAPKPEEEEKAKQMTVGELLEALFSVITCKVPDILIENEANRGLSDLIDQTKKLGLTVDQYLSSTGRSAESMRKEYADNARRTLTLEFALEAIADKESIFISDDDIEKAIKTAKNEEERASLTQQRYYLASILRRQKTLDFLSAV
ncbi:MAG: trigger factor [Patescibacteria group bacterium]